MGGHGGPIPGEHRRVRIPAVRQLYPVRPEIRSRGLGRHHRVRQHQPAGDQRTVPARQRHGGGGGNGRGTAFAVGGRTHRRRDTGHVNNTGTNRTESVPVLLQPRVPGQGGGRIRLAPHHQDTGGRRGHTVDAVHRVVRRTVLLVLSRVETGIHGRQEENSGGQNRKSATCHQVSAAKIYLYLF